jgi:3-phosphoshikimate 1-carboxyvinyltransferase
MLRACGVVVRTDGAGVTLLPTRRGWDGFDARVPGDLSSAVFWIVFAGVTPGAHLRVEGVGLNPGRARILDTLRRAGMRIAAHVQGEERGEPWGRIEVRGAATLSAVDLRGDDVVRCIDEVPALAAAACAAGSTLQVRDAAELRTKESDRIAAILRLVAAFGAHGTGTSDGFRIEPGTVLRAARFDAAGDHRLAMAAALLGFRAPGDSHIDGVHGVATSYPGFIADAIRLLRPLPASR